MTIFGSIVDSWMRRTNGLADMTDEFVSETIKVYSTLLTEMLPTPAKTHYTFNLRDLSKVFQGVLMAFPEKFDVSYANISQSIIRPRSTPKKSIKIKL